MMRVSVALGLAALSLGLAAAVDVEQRIGQARQAVFTLGLDHVADDPEAAPIAPLQLALEHLGLAFFVGQVFAVEGCRRSSGASTPMGWPATSSSSQANMRRAEPFIHSMPCGPTLTMPTSTESRMARSLAARVCKADSACACAVTSSVTTEVLRRPPESWPGATRVSSQRRPSSGGG